MPFEVGVSRYRELARGQIIGDSYGVLKLLVSPDSRKLLGVHVFGTGATELVHIGQAVMGCGGTIDYLVDAVFNYPTLAESYKVAALDATNKMREITRMSSDKSRRLRAVSHGPLAPPSIDRMRSVLDVTVRRAGFRQRRNSSCGRLLDSTKRAPGSVKLRTGGDSPRPRAPSGDLADPVELRDRRLKSGWEAARARPASACRA